MSTAPLIQSGSPRARALAREAFDRIQKSGGSKPLQIAEVAPTTESDQTSALLSDLRAKATAEGVDFNEVLVEMAKLTLDAALLSAKTGDVPNAERREAIRWLHPDHDTELELSLDDVFIVPNLYDGISRTEVKLTPVDFSGGSHPLVSANMNAVTGKRMAETMARSGGLGVLPQDLSLEDAEKFISHIKNADPRYDSALTIGPDAHVKQIKAVITKNAHDMVVVVDSDKRPVGVITSSDLEDRDPYALAREIMTTKPVTAVEGISSRDAFMAMDENRLRALPIVDDSGRLLGMLTKEDCVRHGLLQPALDSKGRLMVAAAIGISKSAPKRAVALKAMGVDVFVLDTAHGHQRRMLEAIKEVRAAIGDDATIVAGNVCTREATRDLCEAGADVIKVNVGPGAMCTTRMQTGVGRPSFTSVLDCAIEAKKMGKHVWADGGVRNPRDVALYLAAGASRVMIGTNLAGTYESPADVQEDSDGARFKANYGMASKLAVAGRTRELDAFEQAKRAVFREGISSSKVYLRPGQESAGQVVLDIVSGVMSTFTYAGAKSYDDFRDKVRVGVQTSGGFTEGTPHGKVRT